MSSTITERRGRGRPRNALPPFPVCTEGDEAVTTQAYEPPASKPRGRPRKIDPLTVQAQVEELRHAYQETPGAPDLPERPVRKANGGTIASSVLSIPAPRMDYMRTLIIGTTPLVLHRFSQKVQAQIRATQEAGSQAKKGRTREARDFEANYQAARHRAIEGWDGIPASAFRNAMISACRTVGFKMTLAKLSIFVMADGFEDDGTPLVRITKGEPRMDVRAARNATGVVDLRSRPMWNVGWQAAPIFRWDTDQFSAGDILSLLQRVGSQVGVGEGRPDSKQSAGIGWGEFQVDMDAAVHLEKPLVGGE